MKRCVVLIVRREGDTYLMGRRNDTNKITFPAGHLEHQEDPRAGAARELLEETGLTASKLSPMGFYHVKPGMMIYVYKASVSGKPSLDNDPDNEFKELFFDKLENIKPEDWHIPISENCALKAIKA